MKFKWLVYLMVVNLLPNHSHGQELKEFQNYFDNKEIIDDIEGIYSFNYVDNSNMYDTYTHTNEKKNNFENVVMAIKGNGNKFYVYRFNEEANLFKVWEGLVIQKINNLYLLDFDDKEYYNLRSFAILGNSFTLSFNRRSVYGQLVFEHESKYSVKEKLYPKITQGENKFSKSGTCFAINAKGYLLTNYHVIKDAKNIYVTLTTGKSQKLKAELISYDEDIDIAILKIVGSNINVPFIIKNKTTDVGISVFTLGYPLTQTMGNEIKLSAGIINSKSGFKGDSKYYQISNPIQPGNSGGPLFDNQGNLIGLVTAKFSGGDNVGYALKSNLILNYLETLEINFGLNQTNKISKLPLQNKYKSLRNFVYFIEVE